MLITLKHATIRTYQSITKTIKTKMKKAKNLIPSVKFSRRTAVPVLVLVGLFAFSSVFVPYVQADRYQEQINALNAENSKKKENKSALGTEANSISDVIKGLQGEINAAQSKINENQSKMEDLQNQIKVAEIELDKQRDLLGQTIRAIYVEGDISTVEMLATSKDLSDFFDKQQYRESVNSKIKSTLERITLLKQDLNTQKNSVAKLIDEQKKLQAHLAVKKSENDRILAMNQSEQSKLDSEMKQNSGRIAELRKKQAEENARLFSRSGGVKSVPDSSGYPWANYRSGSWTHAGSCYYGDDIDRWGMCYRQCVSYAAWKVYKDGKYMPNWGGVGNANQWPANARREGIPVNNSPAPGAIAVSMRGNWGHVMYVESVNSNGSINISQYNVGLRGEYSTASNVSTAGLEFIHF